jgi:hypothetical protein
MATWDEFTEAAPDLAAHGRRLIDATGIVFLASVRRDGAPRLHPVVPLFAAGRVFVFIPHSSPKRHDLIRDGRFVMHASLGENDEEFVFEGRAALIEDDELRTAAVAAASHTIRDTDLCFAFDVAAVRWAVWENMGRPDIRVVRRRWTAL